MTEYEDYKQEERRQSQILAEAIQNTITATGKKFQTPMLNAVAGALVTVEASVVASIADPRTRKALHDAIKKSRPKALSEALSRSENPAIRTATLVVKQP